MPESSLGAAADGSSARTEAWTPVTRSAPGSASAAPRRHSGPSSSDTAPSSRSHACAAPAGRAAGSLASIAWTQATTPGGRSGRSSASGAGSSLTWRSSSAIGASMPSNGCRPASSS